MIQYPVTGHATVEIAEAVAIYWEKIGVKVKRLPVDQGTQRTRQLGRKNDGFAFPVWRLFNDEEAINMDPLYSSWSTGLIAMFEYPEVDDLIKKASSEANKEKRLAIVLKLHETIYENYFQVPISLEHAIIGVGSRIGEWPTLLGDPYLSRFEHIKLK
ncbi:MAG: hypothetical protein HY673_10410 [Chloroflexi bacterium]|nr:hypothetical protein [Chloroflexota bacterium]